MANLSKKDVKKLKELRKRLPFFGYLRFSVFPWFKMCGRQNRIRRKVSESTPSKLDNTDSNGLSSFISSNTSVPLESERMGSNENGRTEKGGENSRRENPVNHTFTLNPRSYLAFPFDVQYVWNTRIRYLVEGERPISVFILDDGTLELFRTNAPYNFYAGNRNLSYHNQRVHLPVPRRYYLVIWNENTEQTAVHYELYVE